MTDTLEDVDIRELLGEAVETPCEWREGTDGQCEAAAERAVRWNCGCVNLLCRPHASEMALWVQFGREGGIIRCEIHRVSGVFIISVEPI